MFVGYHEGGLHIAFVGNAISAGSKTTFRSCGPGAFRGRASRSTVARGCTSTSIDRYCCDSLSNSAGYPKGKDRRSKALHLDKREEDCRFRCDRYQV